jgi:hypothetical protein
MAAMSFDAFTGSGMAAGYSATLGRTDGLQKTDRTIAALNDALDLLAGADPVEWVSRAAGAYLGRVAHLRNLVVSCRDHCTWIRSRMVAYEQAVEAARVQAAAAEGGAP